MHNNHKEKPMPTTNLTAKDLAAECNTDPKTMRKFLREHFRAADQGDVLPGQGGRYGFSKGEAKPLVKAFKAWTEGRAERKVAAAAEASEVEEIIDGDVDEDLDIDDSELDELDA